MEERITEHLQMVLNEVRNGRQRAPGLNEFETVGRGSKVRGAGGQIEIAPDLVFRPLARRGVRDRGAWGWFIECKIVDATHGIKKYVEDGVDRFADGRYAYRMPSAGMLGYVRNRTRPAVALKARLGAMVAAGATSDMAHSRHARAKLATPCVDIVIEHLWLDA